MPSGSKKKIMLVDDEKDFGFFMTRNLEASGEFEVIFNQDSRKVTHLARRQKPDVIILDIMMPQKDGIEVLEDLKRDEKTIGIPVIMLTAREDDVTKIKASGYYAQDYIVKPVGHEYVRERILNVLSQSRLLKKPKEGLDE